MASDCVFRATTFSKTFCVAFGSCKGLMVWTSDKILTRSGEGGGGAVHTFLFERINAKRNHVWFERLAHHSPFVFGLYDTVNVLCQKTGSTFILNDQPLFLLRKQISNH